MITSEEVTQYLQDHPQFFKENPELVESLHFPHPYEGRAISINERQVAMLRERNQLLQSRLQELVDIGEKNDVIGEKMHQLTIALLGFDSLHEMLHGMQYHLCEYFSIPHAALRLWQTDEVNIQTAPSSPEFNQVSEVIHALTQDMLRPYCGPTAEDEVKQWFGEDAELLQSFAMIPLKKQSSFGLLVMASPDIGRFFPDMGTLYLERMGGIVSNIIIRLIQQTPTTTTCEPLS